MVLTFQPDMVEEVVRALKKRNRDQLRLASAGGRRLLQPFTKTAAINIEEVPTVNIERLVSAFPNLAKVIISSSSEPPSDSKGTLAEGLACFFVYGSNAAAGITALDLLLPLTYSAIAVVAASCPGLQHLKITSVNTNAWRALQSLTSIKQLDIQEGNVSTADVKAVTKLSGLEQLTFLGAGLQPSQLDHLQPLSRLTSLQLKLQVLDGINSIAQLTQLQHLSLDWSEEDDSVQEPLAALSSLQNLTSLSTATNSMECLLYISKLTDLQQLSCGVLTVEEVIAALELPALTSLTTDCNSFEGANSEEQAAVYDAVGRCNLRSLSLHCGSSDGHYDYDLSAFRIPPLQSFGNDTNMDAPDAELIIGASNLQCIFLWPSAIVSIQNLARTIQDHRLRNLQVLLLMYHPDDDDTTVMKALASLPRLTYLALSSSAQSQNPLALHPLARSTSLQELVLVGGKMVDARLLATLALAPAVEYIKVIDVRNNRLAVTKAECELAASVSGRAHSVEIVFEDSKLMPDDVFRDILWPKAQHIYLSTAG